MYFTAIKKIEGLDDYDHHQLLWSLFNPRPEKRPFCFSSRHDYIYMRSSIKPNVEAKEIKIEANRTLTFNVVACPPDRKFRHLKIKAKDFGSTELKEWFIKVFAESAHINFVSFERMPPKAVTNHQKNKMVWAQYHFFGTLTVIDSNKFAERITKGIGRGTAFGMGFIYLNEING
jgi:CRISPR-associated protein Cas6/Cse3/CasE subtype I-E